MKPKLKLQLTLTGKTSAILGKINDFNKVTFCLIINFSRPTLMNLSAVGVLPDLRSPESIVNDIECKEKILSDVLNLDRLRISLDQKTSTKNKAKEEEIIKKELPKDTVEEYVINKIETNFLEEKSNNKPTIKGKNRMLHKHIILN